MYSLPMDTKVNPSPNYPMEIPNAPMAPPMYPNIEQHQQKQLLPPVMFYNGQAANDQNRLPSAAPEQRPASVFILNGKPPVGPEPLKTLCPHCNTSQTSRVVARVSLKTHFAALICCVLGLFCLAPIPYCMNAFKNLHHYCNNCGQYLGLYTAK